MIICICRLLFSQAHLGLFIPLFQTLLCVSREARTALPNGLIFISLFEMCRSLNSNLGHNTCCDYVVFSSTIFLEFTLYPFLSSVRSQPAIGYTNADLIKRLSKTFVSLTERHPPAAFCYQRPVPTPLLCISSPKGYCKQSRSLCCALPCSLTFSLGMCFQLYTLFFQHFLDTWVKKTCFLLCFKYLCNFEFVSHMKVLMT